MPGGEFGAQLDGRHRVGLVVIHGVGETEPGYAVNTLLDTLKKVVPGYTITPYSEFQRFEEPGSEAGQGAFPAVSRKGSYRDGTEIEAVELNWADLTQMQPGRLNALLALVRVIFESHHLVDAMLARGREIIPTVSRWLLWFASWMIRGPITALTIATSAYCLFLLFGPVPDNSSTASWLDFALGDEKRRFLIVQAALCLVAIGALVWIAQRKDISWYDTICCLAILTAGLVVLDTQNLLFDWLDKVWDLGDHTARTLNCRNLDVAGACYVNGLYRVIIWGWRFFGWFLLCTVAGVAVLLLWRGWKMKDNPSLAPVATSVGIVILQFMLWTTIVVTSLYTMLTRAELNHELKPVQGQVLGIFDTHKISPNSPAYKLFLFPDIQSGWIERFKFVYGMTALTLVVSFGLVWFLMRRRHAIMRAAGRVKSSTGPGIDLTGIAARMPRLFFSPILVGTLIGTFLILIGLIYFQVDLEKAYPLFVSFREHFLPFAAIVAVAVPFAVSHRISNVVHIARDLIDHQFAPRIETASWFLPWIFKFGEVRPRRERIQSRLVTLIDKVVKDAKFDAVIFVAHSQGSVVAYDYLHRDHSETGHLGGARPQFLSFGSPLGHIYQKYFYEYVPGGPSWQTVGQRLERWVNIYRVEDPIGGWVDAPDGTLVENRSIKTVGPLQFGGHMNYWSDAQIVEALHGLIIASRQSIGNQSAGKTAAIVLPREMPALWPPQRHAMGHE